MAIKMIVIDNSNKNYKNERRKYIKNHCNTVHQGNVHCNSCLFGRQGVGCACLLKEAKFIKDGEEFIVIEPVS